MEPLFELIVAVVSKQNSITPALVLSRERYRSTVDARQLSMYLARQVGFSYPEIGNAFERDHTTCISAVKRVKARRAKDQRFSATVDRLLAEVTGAATGAPGQLVKVRQAIFVLLEKRVRTGLYGTGIEELVDRILCEFFQREKLVK